MTNIRRPPDRVKDSLTPITDEQFLCAIWPSKLLTHEKLELRAFHRVDGAIRRKFATSIDQFLDFARSYGDGWDVYFGIATRFGEGGKKQNCYRVRTMWADLDHRSIEGCLAFDPRPTLLVNSGGGVHAYWCLDHPDCLLGRWEVIETIEARNRWLATKFKADLTAVDITRILRVPGRNNYKYDPPRCVEAYEL